MSLAAAAFVLSVTFVNVDGEPNTIKTEEWKTMNQCVFILGGYSGIFHNMGMMGEVMYPYVEDETEDGTQRVWSMFENAGPEGGLYILECQSNDKRT
jgi:hypothetical protein